MKIINRVQDEGGSALIVGVLILTLILLLGLAVLQTSDVQTHQSGFEASGEGAFNLSESALDAEGAQLEVTWPSTAANAFPVCNQSSTPTTGCPGTTVTNSFNASLAGKLFTNPVWKVQVIDDTNGPSYYSDALLGSAVAYDANGDNRLWVRAESTINGQKRIVVAQMVRQKEVVLLPKNVITSGGVFTSNNGNKVIIEATDPNSGLTGTVDLRCTTGTPAPGDPCAGWDASHGQLSPSGAYQFGYVDPNGGYATLSNDQLNSLRTTAQAQGTYYGNGTCPPGGTSGIVFVENSNCTYNSKTNWNCGANPLPTNATPGALIFASGTLTFNATVNFCGIIYMANAQGTIPPAVQTTCRTQDQNGPVITVHGGGAVYGAVFVDKCGTVDAGSEKFDVNYDSSAFQGFQAFVTPALAKNTFRILPNH